MPGLEAHVGIDEAQVASAARALREVRRGVPRARHRAMRDTVRSSRVTMVRSVASDVAVPQKKLYQKGNRRRPITETLFRGEGGLATGGRVTVGFGRIPLGRFKARQHWKKGKTQGRVRTRVSYKINKRGARQKIQDAFLVEFKSGYTGVYRGWKGRGRKRIGKGQWDRWQLFGPSVPEVAEKRPAVRRLLHSEAGRLLEMRFDQQVAFLMRKAGRR